MKVTATKLIAAIALMGAVLNTGFAQDETAELNKQLNNPVASLITIPIEYNRDSNIGPEETGTVDSIKFSPVVPFEIGENWNLITRTIFSYVEQDIPEYGLDETGLSDIALSLYFTPRTVGNTGIIWGVGPVLLMDSATEDSLGAGKWGAGPAAVALKQMGPWTVGGLSHYLVDYAGDNDREDVEQFFFQPFVSYNLDADTSFTLQAEITRDMNADETGAFALFQANQLFKIGKQMFQARIGVRHWFERAGYGPDSTEFNARLTLLFPK